MREVDYKFDRSIAEEKQRIFKLWEEGKVRTSWVYVVQCNDMYKIGYSDSPERRLEGLQIGNPYDLKLIWKDKIHNYQQIEEALHWKFADKRVRGEWFKLDNKDVDFILAMT